MGKYVIARRLASAIALGVSSLLAAQGAPEEPNAGTAAPARPRLQGPPSQFSAETVRVLVDPSTGDRWLLTRDGNNPAGPGWLIRVAAGDRRMDGNPERRCVVVRAGDRVTVEENTAVAEVRLEATALNSARAGQKLNVRLEIGGAVIRVRAVEHGRVEMAAAEWARE